MKQPGAVLQDNKKCRFTVWAPLKESMHVHIVAPVNSTTEMIKDEEGYFTVELDNIKAGARYLFKPGGDSEYPDPASAFQPEGVHGPSEVVDHFSFEWTDANWQPPPMKDLILYELHTGTFTPEGTFEAIIPRLDDLIASGINAIELMPVNQFPGNRNWGYDGVYPYAVQNSYGGPEKLKELVNACHNKGMALFLDVVYNHLGPEGNYFMEYGPYFTKKYSTPWGDALNFDGDWSDGVRDYFSGNALNWFQNFHIDGLRCDAIHMNYDQGAIHFWEYTHQQVKQLEQQLGRSFYLIAESDLNSPKVIKDPDQGGYGFDAQWLDDFHHALYTLLDKEGKDRYEDYGALDQLVKGYTDGFILTGGWVRFRKRRYGTSSAGISGERFIVFNQNHDQVGNRVKGDRLASLVNFARLKIASAAILLSPCIPMFFMGEEYGERTPFYYFISHSDKALIAEVQKGRNQEFARFGFDAGPPDPEDEKTFKDCVLKWNQRNEGDHAILLEWNKTLIALRRHHPALQNLDKKDLLIEAFGEDCLVMHRTVANGNDHLVCVFNFSEKQLTYQFPEDEVGWKKILDSTAPRWREKRKKDIEEVPEITDIGAVNVPPVSVAVYERLWQL